MCSIRYVDFDSPKLPENGGKRAAGAAVASPLCVLEKE